MLPGIVQPGKKIANADKALAAVVATFTPAKKGRAVVLQKKAGSKWVNVATGVQDSGRQGRVRRARRLRDEPGHLPRRRAEGLRACGTVASRAVATSQWGPATFTDQFPGTALSANWVHRMQFYQPAVDAQLLQGRPVGGRASRRARCA